jgi:hypothetical protein
LELDLEKNTKKFGEKKREEYKKKELEECTFTPMINSKKAKIERQNKTK